MIRVFPDLFIYKRLKGCFNQVMKEWVIFPWANKLTEGGQKTVREWPVVKGIKDILE